MRRSRQFTLMMAIIALILYSTGTARSDEPVPVQDEPILIIPTEKLPPTVAAPAPIVPENGAPIPGVDSAEYRRIYRSIPFSRAEYRVNPGYRHDSTMEILTGNARHQTIVQHNHEHKDKEPVKRLPVPARPSRVLTPFSGFGNLWGAPLWNYRPYGW
jgi:hypothetical protein